MISEPKIGAFLLESITTGMYLNPLDAIREYVQNATDSLLFNTSNNYDDNHKKVVIKIDPNKRSLIIHDNGTGIPKDNIHSQLINIGMSQKQIEKNIGFRGLGRLAGTAYCEKIIFRTTTKGEKITSNIEINCKKLKETIKPDVPQIEELADVILKNSKIYEESCSEEEHYFDVIMENIIDSAYVFLDWKLLEEYLCQTAPIGFDSQSFIFAPIINDWIKKNNINVPQITLLLKSPNIEREIFKPYKTHYQTRNAPKGNFPFDIKNIGFYPEPFNNNSPFWIWYGKTDLLGSIDDIKASGFRFKMKNITIGNQQRVADIFSETSNSNARFNSWFIGEIHILSNEVIPNARRDGFEDTSSWVEIKKQLMPFIKEKITEIRKSSEERNIPIQKIIRKAENVILNANERLDNGFISKEQHENHLNNLIQVKKQVDSSIEKHASLKNDSNKIEDLKNSQKKLELLIKTLEQEPIPYKKVLSNLDRKQRKLLREILLILHKTLDEENFKKAEQAINLYFKCSNSILSNK